MPRIKSISTTASGRAGGCATAFIVAFLGLFVIVGSAASAFSCRPGRSITPTPPAAWTPTACEVISSRIVHGDDTSRPDIVYRYTIGGRQYTANRYNFIPGSTNDSTVPAVVAKHAPGTKFECYVDPDGSVERGDQPDAHPAGITWACRSSSCSPASRARLAW